jgi:hypothetical protein
MDAQSYFEWSKLSGLYLRNLSCLDRYQTYRPLISEAGFTTVVVSEFLKDIQDQWSVEYWRTYAVYETSPQADQRVELTATALDAIGAIRIAAAVRRTIGVWQVMIPTDITAIAESKAGPSAPSRHESREEIESLLQQYVVRHQAELQADLDKHGDPRTKAGYTREDRLAELETKRQRYFAVRDQRQIAERLGALFAKLQKVTTNTASESRKSARHIEKLRDEFRDQLKLARAHSALDPIPELIAALANADTLMTAHPDLFAMPTIGDVKTMSRLEALGEYECLSQFGKGWIEWDSPSGFPCDWTSFSLRFTTPSKQWEAVPAALDAVEQLQSSFMSQTTGWRRDLISNFRDVYQDQMEPWELEQYELDDQGVPTESSILSHVGGGAISVECSENGVA